MAGFPGAEPVFVFHIYLLSPTALHQLPERNTHDCKALLNVQQLCKLSSSFVWCSLQPGTKVFCQNKVQGVSNTHLAAAVRGRAGQWELYSSLGPAAIAMATWVAQTMLRLMLPTAGLGSCTRAAALRIPPPSFSTLIHKNQVFFILPFPFLPVHGTSRSILITRNSWNTFIFSFPYTDIKIPGIQPDKPTQEVTANMLIFFTGGLHFFHNNWWGEEKIYP